MSGVKPASAPQGRPAAASATKTTTTAARAATGRGTKPTPALTGIVTLKSGLSTLAPPLPAKSGPQRPAVASSSNISTSSKTPSSNPRSAKSESAKTANKSTGKSSAGTKTSEQAPPVTAATTGGAASARPKPQMAALAHAVDDLALDSGDSQSVPQQMLKQARASGQLNLSGRGLVVIPDKVFTLCQEEEGEDKQRGGKTSGFCIDKIPEDSDAWWNYVDLTKLIVACNRISTLPPQIKFLSALTILDAHDNALEELPAEIGELENLAKLNVSHNKIRSLPESIFSLRWLKSFVASNNQIAEISENINKLEVLEHLDLSHNRIASLPSSVGFVTKLRDINLSHNCLRTVPSEISFLQELATIDLTSNEIDRLSEGTFADLNKLECVYLRHNKLKAFPNFRGCDNLKEVHAGNNKLTDLSVQEISAMLSIRQLDLRDNKIPSLPEEISNLQLLERLDVTNNELPDLPASLGVLPNLKSLLVEGNALRTIRRDIIQRGTTGLLKYLRARLTDADLSRLRERGAANVSPTPALGSSPPIPDKYAMKAAKALNLAKKELKHFPANALDDAKEAAVTAVDLSKNYFASVPDDLQALVPQLQELNFSANQIAEIPPWLGALGSRNLLYLNLCNNRLSSLPPELAQLSHLREIALSYNRLTCIPACLFECAKLETLVLNGNQIGSIDVDGLSRLTALAVLDLQNNSIERVPPELGLMTQLRSLQLEGNTFRSPRPQVLLQGTEAVLAYLRDRIPK